MSVESFWSSGDSGVHGKRGFAAVIAVKTGVKRNAANRREKTMPPILGTRGVEASMLFPCCDCGDVTTGEEVLRGAYVHVVMRCAHNLKNSLWRCECCQEELEDQERN